MTVWTCATCAIEHADTAAPPAICGICADERQFVPPGGQRWTTRQELESAGHRITVRELEDDLYAVDCEPRLGIGQRGLLLRTRHGNLLWEPPGFIDAAGVAAIAALGGIAVIAASHPHLIGSSIQWSHAFGGAPVYVAAADQEWIRRPDAVIRLWTGSCDLLPGVRMHQCGGHFAGSSVIHWHDDDDDDGRHDSDGGWHDGGDGDGGRHYGGDGDGGRHDSGNGDSGPHGGGRPGVLLTGDTIAVGADRKSVNAMRSYVNNIPLSEPAVRRILDTVMPLEFDRIYSAFARIDSAAHDVVDMSLRRYIRWIRGEADAGA
ncbi:hydrolase [Paenarthrobacter sp. Z7-10]|uniref:hydrolase n=1 Tax=Paenarthrobacter sp. Z7-10 TaxID=2787635 RepID=UPI0022A8F13D|nr:hydrolase [Paenarthrobacter sp. Z7-10]MCZ2404622.1 hydrolase [Paenarthrobacter sp. Z7-10]